MALCANNLTDKQEHHNLKLFSRKTKRNRINYWPAMGVIHMQPQSLLLLSEREPSGSASEVCHILDLKVKTKTSHSYKEQFSSIFPSFWDMQGCVPLLLHADLTTHPFERHGRQHSPKNRGQADQQWSTSPAQTSRMGLTAETNWFIETSVLTSLTSQ